MRQITTIIAVGAIQQGRGRKSKEERERAQEREKERGRCSTSTGSLLPRRSVSIVDTGNCRHTLAFVA